MIDWREIEELPGDLAPGRSFLFCTLGKHIFPVTLVVRNGEALCCSRDNAGANAAVLLEEDALVTHFAEAELPQASERQITAAAARVANLDERCRPAILARRVSCAWAGPGTTSVLLRSRPEIGTSGHQRTGGLSDG